MSYGPRRRHGGARSEPGTGLPRMGYENTRGTRLGSSGRRGAGVVKRQWLIATLIASATLAFAGVTEASVAASSPPAPHRAAASPRHSAAGASATATHAARSHHKRKHHLRRHTADHAQLQARNPNTAAGGSPPQPARRSPITNHHAALRPASHELRPLLRNRAHGNGAIAASFARIDRPDESSRLCSSLLTPTISNEDRVNQGRGPPRGSPELTASLPPLYEIPGSNAFPTHHPLTFDWSRDRLPSLPHAVRLEGAVACSDCPP
jgi:hypothetical protein